MVYVRRQANEILTVRADQLIPEVHEEVVPEEPAGGLVQVRDEAADVAVAAPALGGELLPQAVFSKAKELVLRWVPGVSRAGNGSRNSGHDVSYSHGAPNLSQNGYGCKLKGMNILTLWGSGFGATRLSFMTHA